MCLASNVYAKDLSKKGHGYPLWFPEPSETAGEIQIGDVGFLHDGSFIRLFNITLPSNEGVNRNGVPREFETIEFGKSSPTIRNANYLEAGMIQNARKNAVQAESTGLDCLSSCAQQGSVLQLKDRAVLTEIPPGANWEDYLQKHLSNWDHFMTEIDYSSFCNELILVTGTVKTSAWNVVACWDQNEQEIITNSGVSTTAENHISNYATESRTGPIDTSIANEGYMASKCAVANQCVFLRYYKLKRRAPKGSALQRLGGGERHSMLQQWNCWSLFVDIVDEDDSVDIVNEYGSSDVNHPYDPLNDVLDSILNNSEAEIALAHTHDLIALNSNQQPSLPPPKTVYISNHGFGKLAT